MSGYRWWVRVLAGIVGGFSAGFLFACYCAGRAIRLGKIEGVHVDEVR